MTARRTPTLSAACSLLACSIVALGGCPAAKEQPTEQPTRAAAEAAPAASPPPASEPAATAPSLSDPHRVVFADRTSQGYLLLVDGSQAEKPTREGLAALVREKLSAPTEEPERELLLELVQTEPMVVDPKIVASQTPTVGAPRETTDLLGLHVDSLPLRSGEEALIAPETFTDPVLVRELSPEDRASLAKRRHAILLRADYRNRHAVRGLRLLQTLVGLVADDRDALVHDPDTGETMSAETFARRRLQTSLGNIADQVAVVPFRDPRHGEGYVRLATRGMRRFGSVDLELDGLPRDPRVLQAATDFLYGLAREMVELGEFDATGYSVELAQEVEVEREDVARAYGSARGLPDCGSCSEAVAVHLVERESEPHDPREHVVTRVVAPRNVSDTPGYDHPTWARETLQRLLGV